MTEYDERSGITLEGWRDGKLGLYCHVLGEGVHLELTADEVHELILKLTQTLPFGLRHSGSETHGKT
jgi:hypothetical protein